MLSLVQTIMRHDQIEIQVDIPDDLPCIRCRSQQIQQVIMNILTNARDALNRRYPGYDDDKKIVITARATHEARAAICADDRRGPGRRDH